MATVAHSSWDDVVPYLSLYLPEDVQIPVHGCLDGLTREDIAALGPAEGEVGIVVRLPDGGSTLLSHSKILPRMQRCVDELIGEDGADFVVILCGADWSQIKADRLVVNPGRLFPSVMSALGHGQRLGIIKPSSGQVDQERARYQALGIEAVVTAASPYPAEERLVRARRAAEQLREAECDLIWMTCVGMDAAMRDVVAEVTRKPVVLAHALLARIVSELIESRQPALTGLGPVRIATVTPAG
jgi:protein AroM